MAIKLRKEDQEFRNPLIFPMEAKTIDLDRALLNLFILIQHNGVLPRARAGRKNVTPDLIVQRLIKLETEGVVKGFSDHPEQARWWVLSNLVDVVNRGNPDKEAIASLKALHLNSYRFRNPKHCRDYNASHIVYMMLAESPDNLLGQLRSILVEGWDSMSEQIDGGVTPDLDILGILRIVEGVSDDPSGDLQSHFPNCLCTGQARLFADDVRKLLIYQGDIPRHVLLGYLKVLIGLHVSMYLFKLFLMLPDYVKEGERNSICKNCPVSADSNEPFAECPYHKEFVVDCGDDPEDYIAQLAETDATFFYARVHGYVRATFGINMALQVKGLRDRRDLSDLDEALEAIRVRDNDFDLRFKLRIEDLLDSLDEEQRGSLQDIQSLGLPPFETFVEMVTHIRASFHNQYHRQMLDSLLQRNREAGLIWSGRSRRHGRRFWLSSRMLEALVQLAVLQEKDGSDGKKRLVSEPLLIEELLEHLLHRYGFVVNGTNLDRFDASDVSIHHAFRTNVKNLKRRLREIGFFNVLSDAYIMQRIRPRYEIEREL